MKKIDWGDVIVMIAFFVALVLIQYFFMNKDCKAEDIWTYDNDGVWNGSIDNYGNQYDRNGTYKGIVDVMGNIYNRDGIWKGYVEVGKDTGPRPVYIIPND